jgi:hypothetical protein
MRLFHRSSNGWDVSSLSSSPGSAWLAQAGGGDLLRFTQTLLSSRTLPQELVAVFKTSDQGRVRHNVACRNAGVTLWQG